MAEVPSCDSPRAGTKRARGGGTRKKRDRTNRQLSNSGIMAPRMNTVSAAMLAAAGNSRDEQTVVTLRRAGLLRR